MDASLQNNASGNTTQEPMHSVSYISNYKGLLVLLFVQSARHSTVTVQAAMIRAEMIQPHLVGTSSCIQAVLLVRDTYQRVEDHQGLQSIW